MGKKKDSIRKPSRELKKEELKDRVNPLLADLIKEESEEYNRLNEVEYRVASNMRSGTMLRGNGEKIERLQKGLQRAIRRRQSRRNMAAGKICPPWKA